MVNKRHPFSIIPRFSLSIMFIFTVRIGDCPPLHLRHSTVDCVCFINSPYLQYTQYAFHLWGGGGPYTLHCFTCFRGKTSARIFKQSMRARNRVGIRLSYRPARLYL